MSNIEDPEDLLEVTPPKTWATGLPAVTHAMQYSLGQTSVRRTALTLLNINQTKGFDCPGCAWPEPGPGHRAKNEYCENGAKHINDEATSRRVTADFFREHSVSELGEKSDYWLNQQGRLTEPMVKRPGADHYEPIGWDDALALLAEELRRLDSPDEALFYTSGRLNNEAAFLLQLFARAYGTNNLPDCSNMCHESSGSALQETLGIGKGSVSLDDIHHSDLVFVVGQNPGTNHPRMLSALEETKRNGGHIVDAKVFVGVAGNFVRATPDSEVTERAMRRCRLTAHISTKLNRSHTVCGGTALILPTLGRSDRDIQAGGEQFITVEDSMSEVHASRGRLHPASPHLLSEVAIISRLARRTLGDRPSLPWEKFEADYGTIRDRISRVVPGFEDFNSRVARPGGFRLPNPVNEGVFPTPSGKAVFTRNDFEMLRAPQGHLLLQTLRSHDQWNTVPYAMNDRYRGIHNARRVVLVNPADLEALGLADRSEVDLVSVWRDGVERRAEKFRVVAYPTTPGSAAAYYPETNVLVPLDSVADISNTPTSKGVVVRLEPAVAVG